MITSSRTCKINLHQISKIIAFVYIIVSKVLIPLEMSNGFVGYLILALLFSVVVLNSGIKLSLNRFMYTELLFLTVTFITSLFVCKNSSFFIDSALTLVSGFVFGICMICITKNDNSIIWFVRMWIVACVLLMGFLLFTGGYSSGKLNRLSLNEGFNSNTLGVFFMFGIWSVLYTIAEKIKKQTIRSVYFALSVGLIAAFSFIIIRTGSRKALIASVFLIVAFVLFGNLLKHNLLSMNKRIILFSVLIIVILIIYYRYGQVFNSASETFIYRMERLSEERISDTIRYDLLVDAWKVFLKHPFVGVGWNNYKVFSIYSVYSHNSFIEVLACTGVVGAGFVAGLWIILINRINNTVKRPENRPYAVCYISLLLVFLFINMVQIIYYNSSLLMIMHLLLSLTLIENDSIIGIKENEKIN